MLIESPAAHARKREPARLIGVEDRMFVEVEGHGCSDAIADQDLDHEYAAQTSAVHLVRSEFTKAARDAVRARAASWVSTTRTTRHIGWPHSRRWRAWQAI